MQTIVFDVETGPLAEGELSALLPPFDPAEVKTGNLKDPAKIAEKLAEAEVNHRRNFFDNAALDPLTGRVVAIGMLVFEEMKSEEWRVENGDCVIIGHDDEGRTLREFWRYTQAEMGRMNPIIGFNIFTFDLPFLFRRSWKRRVPIPFGLRRGRYWGDQVIDLRDAWQLGDRQARGSLDSIAKHLGVGAKCVPHGPPGGKLMTGADFAEMWKRDRAKAEAYLRNDLELTAKIALGLGICV